MNSKKKVLIIGGAGFIGSHLCEALFNSGNYDVYSLDNYFTGSIDNHIKGVKYINGISSEIEKHINFKPDYIYHLGEYSRVEQSFDDVHLVWKLNINGIFSVLEFCRKHKAKLIYEGSSTKFGDGGLGRNQSPYSWSKATNTELVINYGKWFNVKYAITYFYNVYGSREISEGKYATVIAMFNKMKLQGKELTVVKPGTQKRNFTHVEDIINGLILVGEKGDGDNYGIGSPESFSILEIAKMFDGKIKMLPERPGNRLTAEVIIEKTKKLGWKPTHSIKEYIKKLNKKS